MSIATVTHRHVFGLRGDVVDNICYLDEQQVIYPAGNNIVVYNVEQKTQKFIPGTEKTEGIMCMCVSPNKRYCAIAEGSDKTLITIFDLHSLKRRKILSTTDVTSKEIVSMCFSADSKNLLAQGGDPDWTLVLWSWDKAKVLCSVKVSNDPVRQCSFSPQDGTQMCVTGKGVFKLFKFIDNQLKHLAGGMGKKDSQNYTCHAWVSDDKLVVGTDTGELLLVEGGELRLTLPNPFASLGSEGFSIDAIANFSKGFVCSGQGGQVCLYEKTDDKDFCRKTKTLRVENSAAVKIRNLAISPSEENMICSLDNNQAYVLGLSNTDMMKAEDMSFEHLSQPFHSSQITGIDCCVRKPLIATCSTDHSVRIWNYIERTCDLVKVFPEEANSIAFHPSGFHILVGFSDKLRLMNLLMDDIRTYKEFTIRSCKECRFSNGGHLFAAVNGNTIQIFSTYTFENTGNLRGHNSKVRSVFWTPDDSKLISSGMDGAVYEWKVKEFKRENENVLKTCVYSSAVAMMDGRTIFAVGSDRKLKEITESMISKEFDTQGTVPTKVVISNNNRMLFLGSENGTVRSYKFPLTGEYQEHQVHQGHVSYMQISHDDNFLFSVGDDGCLFVFDIRDKEGRPQKREKDAPFAEEILITKTDVEEKTQAMQELKLKVDELTMQNDYQLRLREMQYQEKLKDSKDNAMAELAAETTKYEVLLQEKSDMEAEYEDRIKKLVESHTAEVQKAETQHQQKIIAEVERYHNLLADKNSQHENNEDQIAIMMENHERAMRELTDDYEAKQQEDSLIAQRAQAEKEELVKEFEETKRQIEEDADQEIEDLKEKYETKLALERDVGLRLKGENGIMRKKFGTLQKEIEDRAEEIKTLYDQKKELFQNIASLEKDVQGLKKEIKERDETIIDKEKRIQDLKKKNQELEKFKFVLDYKIKDLKKNIEPREAEIEYVKGQMKEMDQELERYHKNNNNLELRITDMNLKIESMNREILAQRQKIVAFDSRVRRFRSDLHDTVQHIQDPKALKEAVKYLYQKHVTQQVEAAGLDVDIEREYNRQREYLERSVASLRKKLGKDSELHRVDNERIMQENVVLIREINELRKEVKVMKQEKKLMDSGISGLAGNNNGVGVGVGGRRAITPVSIRLRSSESSHRPTSVGLDGGGEVNNDNNDDGTKVENLDGFDNLKRPVSREKLPPLSGFEET